MAAGAAICTRTGSGLSGVPLLVGMRRGIRWCSRQEFRLQPPRSKRGALYIELRERFDLRVGGSQWTCSTTRTNADPSDFQSAAARWSALASVKIGGPGWTRTINLPSQSRALHWLSYGAKRSANRTCAGLASLPMTCVAAYALAELKLVGHPGAAPGVSPIRTAWIAVFLVPEEIGGVTGTRTPVCAMPLRCPALER